jgi:hypothetical protein
MIVMLCMKWQLQMMRWDSFHIQCEIGRGCLYCTYFSCICFFKYVTVINYDKQRGSSINYMIVSSIPVAARSKAWVCRHVLAGIAGLNPARDMDVCLSLVRVVGLQVEVCVLG